MAFYEEERFPVQKPENFFETFALMGNNHSNLSNEFPGEQRKTVFAFISRTGATDSGTVKLVSRKPSMSGNGHFKIIRSVRTPTKNQGRAEARPWLIEDLF
jgi:hypothetical protein